MKGHGDRRDSPYIIYMAKKYRYPLLGDSALDQLFGLVPEYGYGVAIGMARNRLHQFINSGLTAPE